MRLTTLDLDPANANLIGFLSNATGAGPFTMTTTSSGDGLAHQVSIRNDSATDHSGKTLVLTGTDADSKAITETVTGPGVSATVESTKYFLTLTSATVSATIGADTFDFGWVDEFVSKTIPLDRYSNIAATVQVTVTGTINYTVTATVESPWDSSITEQSDLDWLDDAGFTGLTSSKALELASRSLGALRILVNSYTDGAELQVFISQAE